MARLTDVHIGYGGGHMWTQGTVLGGRYTLTGRVGGGAMGDVWRADDQVLERQVAVKVLLPALLDDEAFAARFRREAKVLAGLDHPGIVDVHDYGEEEVDAGTRIAYIVMEFVSGRPLDALLRERGPLPAAEALGIAAQTLDALHAAHRRDVVHRDIKPANLMVGDDGRVTVTDFGIARALSATKLTAAHEVLGTALYIAPESAEGVATLPASDLYSLGVVLHEMLTGECPFGGETLLEIILKHIREPAPPLPEGFPAPVRELVSRALAKRPEDRYPSAAAMADAARRAATGAVRDAGAVLDAGAAGIAAGAGAPDGTLQLSAKPSAELSGAAGGQDGGENQDGGRKEPAVPPLPATPPAAAAPAPAVVIATATPGGATATVPQQRRRWRRPGLVFPLVIPVVVASTAGTVLLMQPTPYSGRSNGPAAPVASVTSGAPTAGGQSGPAPASPSTGASGAVPPSPSPNTSTTTTTSGQASGGANGGVALPVQQGGGNGGGNGGSGSGSNPGSNKGGSGSGSGTGSQSGSGSGSGSSSGSGTGSGTGSGSGGGAGNSSGGGSGSGSGDGGGSGPASGCGGTGWGAITNVSDGLRLGLSSGSPGAGTAAVLGANTRFGWVAVPNVQEVVFHECNANGLPLGYPYTAAGGNIELAGPTSYGDQTGWVLTQSPRSGAYYIKVPYGPYGQCLTGHGAGNRVTVENCADGLSTQEWRVP